MILEQKMADFREFGSLSLTKTPGRPVPGHTYPQDIHRLYLGGFGSLPNPPRLFNYVARLLAFPPILLLLLGSRPLDLIDLIYQRSPSLEELLNCNALISDLI